MQSLLNPSTKQDVLNRIENLNENTPASWGKMNVGQMLKHCQLPLDLANGNLILTEKIGSIKKLVLKLFKPFMYNDKPWKHNLQTAKQFIITDKREFANEKEQLIQTINTFSNKTEDTDWPPHPLFGNFTPEQWGKMQYKHLDHHLTQFGV